MARPTKALILLHVLRANLDLIKQKAGSAKVIPVVKADAYGHGAVEVSRALVAEDIKSLAVACIEEAVELDQAGIKAKIIILGPLREDEIEETGKRGFVPVLSSFQDLDMIAAALKKNVIKNSLEAIIDIDTGMGRTGFLPEDVSDLPARLSNLSGIRVTGLFSHLPVSDSRDEDDIEYTRRQLQDFRLIAKAISAFCPDMEHVSIANSGGIIFHRDSMMSAIRPGLMLYGAMPAPGADGLLPVMRWTTRIDQIRRLPAGSSISYGRKTRLTRESLLAVIPVGYADGLKRTIPPGFGLYVRAQKAPIAGVVTMDFTMLDVTAVPGAEPGDTVLIMGSDLQSPGGDEKDAPRTLVTITPDEHAQAAGTIPYEILTSIGKRVKRTYIDERPKK